MLCWWGLVLVFSAGGCKQTVTDMDVLASGAVVGPHVAVPDYAGAAIEATGGLDAWTETKKLQFDGVVTIYKPDGSYYLTEQHYEAYPWLDSIRISAREPHGKCVWELLRGSSQKQASWYKGVGLPIELCGKSCFAEAILDITTAPVRFMDGQVQFAKKVDAVKVQSRWYYLVEQTIPSNAKSPAEQYWSKAVFYQNRDNLKVEMIWLSGTDSEGKKPGLMVFGYDYRQIEGRGTAESRMKPVYIPGRIELYETDAEGLLGQRLVKILIVDR